MKNSAFLKVLAAIVLAIFFGFAIDPDSTIFGVSVLHFYDLIGKLFLNALTLVVVPIVCSSIITGTARMAADRSFKSLGIKTFGYFVGTTFLAILVGYFLVTWFQPGADQQGTLGKTFVDAGRLQDIQIQAQQEGFEKVEQLLLSFFPTNILAAASQGQMIGLIIFCMLFGFFIHQIEKESAKVVLSFWQGLFEIMMKITQLIMRALPLGVFALVAKTVALTGIDSIASVVSFFMVVVLGLLIDAFVVFPCLLRFIAKASAKVHFEAMAPALLTAFSTSSSAATMPLTLECLEKRARLPSRVCNITVPLGTAINMPGTALYICAAVFFIAQVYGISLGWATQGVILLMILLISFGIAGIPSASLFAVVTILNMSGLPVEGIALILAVERLLDMCRSTVNVLGTSCCSVLIANKEPIEEPIPVPMIT